MYIGQYVQRLICQYIHAGMYIHVGTYSHVMSSKQIASHINMWNSPAHEPQMLGVSLMVHTHTHSHTHRLAE